MANETTFEWDGDKAASNAERHGVRFEEAKRFEFDAAMILSDDRRDYGEERMVATGLIGARVHVLVYTLRSETVRVISLRKANSREIKAYVEYLER